MVRGQAIYDAECLDHEHDARDFAGQRVLRIGPEARVLA